MYVTAYRYFGVSSIMNSLYLSRNKIFKPPKTNRLNSLDESLYSLIKSFNPLLVWNFYQIFMKLPNGTKTEDAINFHANVSI